MNVHLRLDNTTPTKLLGPSGAWVKKHRALRNEEEQETGTVMPHTDYLEAMDQWIVVLDDQEALKASNKDETETLRQAHKAKTQMLQAEMATRMRDRVRLAEEEEAAGAAEDIIPEDQGVFLRAGTYTGGSDLPRISEPNLYYSVDVAL
jgi:hypothetical protein